MAIDMVTFVLSIVVVALAAAFFLGLASKWGWLEWLQVHAPNDLIHELLMCKFCCSWWMGVALSVVLALIFGEWWVLLVPLCSTPVTRELW